MSLVQALAWLAVTLGLTGSWVVGSGRRVGWLLGLASACLWFAVDTRFGIWAGVAAAALAAAVAVRNWRRA